MYSVDDKPETIHLYVVREEEKRPYTAFPLFCALLCLVGIVELTLYSAQHPYYERKQITVPAMLLPLKVFEAQVPIIPTGIKTYPATYAHGTLTITNGSVISQELPLGVIFIGNSGVSVKTDQKVFVPAGNADGFGMSTVSAHLLTSGINMSTLSINQVIGTSLYVRNLTPFIGGRPAHTVNFATAQDRELALTKSRRVLTLSITGFHYPCVEQVSAAITVTWRCQFATYHVPSSMRVLGATLAGRDFLVTVEFTPHPRQFWVK